MRIVNECVYVCIVYVELDLMLVIYFHLFPCRLYVTNSLFLYLMDRWAIQILRLEDLLALGGVPGTRCKVFRVRRCVLLLV